MKPFLVIWLFPLLAFGQGKFSLGVDFAIPNGTSFNNVAGNAWGGSFRYEMPVTSHFAAIGTIGYLYFAEKGVPVPTSGPPFTISSQISFLPIQLGAKFYLFTHDDSHEGLFVSGELGVHTIYYNDTIDGIKIPFDSETYFSYAPGIGVRLSKFEIGYRQQFISSGSKSLNFSNFRLAYLF